MRVREALEHGPRGRRHLQEVEVQVRKNHRRTEWIHLQHEAGSG